MFVKIDSTIRLLVCSSIIASASTAYAVDTDHLISLSDDLNRYRTVFAKAAVQLIEDGTCTEVDFIENGDWVRSQSFKPRPVYFIYCGGATIANRLYLDAKTSKIFK